MTGVRTQVDFASFADYARPEGQDEHVAEQRERLITELVQAVRLMIRQHLRYTDAVADQLGLPVTDLVCLGTLRDWRRATAGDLATELGLTTGAVTRMIDRLHRAGFVRRLPDPDDGRRVIVELIPESEGAIAGLFGSQAVHLNEVAANLTDAELRLLLRYTRDRADVSRDAADRLRREGRPHASRRSRQ